MFDEKRVGKTFWKALQLCSLWNWWVLQFSTTFFTFQWFSNYSRKKEAWFIRKKVKGQPLFPAELNLLTVKKVKKRSPRCLKITEKVSFNIANEASYVYILSRQNFIKNAKNGPFWRVFENLKLAVKQCYQTGQF